jgi:hypothetical protein
MKRMWNGGKISRRLHRELASLLIEFGRKAPANQNLTWLVTSCQKEARTLTFAQLYTDFMAAVANHIKVITPFMPALTEMLHRVPK